MLFLTRAKKRVISAICACALAFTATTAYNGGVGGTRPITVAAAADERVGATYNFGDKSIISDDTKGSDTTSTDGKLTVKAGGYRYNDESHGVEFGSGCSIEIKVDGATKLTFGDCAYTTATKLTLASKDGSYSETKPAKTGCGKNIEFNYTQNVEATLVMSFTDNAYISAITTEPIEASTEPQPDVKATYDFMKGEIVSSDFSGTDTIVYGKMTIKPGSAGACTLNSSHGAYLKNNTTIEIKVSGATKVTVGDCQFTKMENFTLKSADGKYTEGQPAGKACYSNGSNILEFNYTQNAPTTLSFTFDNEAYVPIIITEPIEASTDPKPDTKATYNFTDGSIIPSDKSYNGGVAVTSGNLTIKPGPSTGFGSNGDEHGAILKNTNSIEIKVNGPTKVTVGDCGFNSVTELTLKNNAGYSETQAVKKGCYHDDNSAAVFTYKGTDPTTLIIEFTGQAYVPIIITEPIEVTEEPDPSVPPEVIGNGKADVWDFGAEALDGCNNLLDVATINGFYTAGTEAGSSGVNLPSFTAGDLRFEANGKTNHRLRTTNESLTRYDSGSKSVGDTTLSGYIYSNSESSSAVYLAVKLYANDILTVYASNNGKNSTIVCESGSNKQSQVVPGGTTQILTFYAPEDGEYKLYSADEKLVVARLIREHTNPVKVSGTINTSEATGIADYKLCFTNTSTGKATEVAPKNGEYTVYLYDQYTYEMSLVDANGYIIKNGTELNIPKGSSDLTKDVEIKSVDLVTVTGSITGLSADELKKLKLSFTNAEKIYVPEITITGSTFTLKLEESVTYKITAEGVNDSALSADTISASTNGTKDIAFTKKPVYDINITLDGLPDTAPSAAFTFTNINEVGYTYTFAAGETPKLRDGSYTVKVTGTGSAPYVQKLTSNVNVNGAAVSKTISFEPIEAWDFSKYNSGNPGIETIGSDKYYLGLELTGGVKENGIYLLVGKDQEVKIPVKKDQIVTLEYCYEAAFEVEGQQVLSFTKKTDKIESIQVIAPNDGFVTVKGITGTTEDGKTPAQTYFTKITVATAAEYKAKLTVGADKEYQTINEALAAAAKMDRPNNERVEIVIDPGNYEEMLVVNIPNVSLINAAGESSSLEITNKGVDIGANVVRITSYYGHGYNYYSMGSDCKWNAEVLAANKSNGYISTENPGAGTTNGSYWNSTVVIMGDGFEADGIVFENSFNQYISNKEAADTVVMWETGSKGQRPTTAGNTSVQQKSFVERAAAISIVGDKSVFNNCKFIGRQDTLYGGQNIKAVFQKCDVLGAVDFIFGGMNAVFYQCNLVMNTSEDKNDVSYLTAPQQASGRGYLMYNCTVTSTTPGVDTASAYRSKPGYFGRPWQANTSEVVFYKTVIETTNYYSLDEGKTYEYYEDCKSLIEPMGWNSSLGGTSPKMYEYGTTEESGEDNSASRVDWVTANINSETTPITIEAFLGNWTDELNERGLVLELGDTPDTPGTDTPGTDTPGTDTPGTDTPGTSVTPTTPVTPDTSDTPKDAAEFEDSDIKVTAPEGAFNEADEVTFNADPVIDETTDDMFTFDLSFTDKNGDKVQPAVAVTVRIPLPAALANKTVYVYHVEDDGTYTWVDCTVKDGMVVFTASKFSKYIVTSEKLAAAPDDTSKPSDGTSSGNSSSDNTSGSGSNTNPSTGIGGMNYAFAAAAVLAGGVFIAFKKKNS